MPWAKIKPEPGNIDCSTESAECGRRISYPEAIREAFATALEIDPKVFLMGQGVDDHTGYFGASLGLRERFGRERVFDTPLSETALTGVATGAAIGGMRPVYLHNRPDFLLLAMDQLVNHAAKWHYMFGGAVNVPLVVWACIGRGWGGAAQHSQALQGLFLHVPGLKLVMPSTCYDTKGLILSAIADPNPVLIIEHRFNFKQHGFVPEEPYRVPIGKGIVRRAGKDITIAAISHSATEAVRAAEQLAAQGIEAEVIDLRTLRPLDERMLLDSIAKTGRLIVADTGWKTGGATAEIAAVAVEKGFHFLKAPVRRIATADVPTPSGFTLEQGFYTGAPEIIAAAVELLGK